MPKVQTRQSKTLGTRYFVRLRVRGVQTTVTFSDKAAADRFARDVDNRGGNRAFDDYMAEEAEADELTMSQWAERYMEATTVSPGHLDNIRRDWRRRWEPHLGHLTMSRVGREEIVAAVKQQTGKQKTIENAWGSLTQMMKTAVIDGHIERSPCFGVKLPTHETDEDDDSEQRFLTQEELLQVVEDTHEQFRPLVWMLIGTGMRWSEATALTVGDINVSAQTVRINKAWKRDRANKTYYVGAPKTKKAKRTITLPKEVIEAVRPLLKGRARADRLFLNTRGDYVKHDTFYREHWVKKCTRNIEQPRPRIHDLRHSHVAILIQRGVQLPVISARLGHKSIDTTFGTYGHLVPDLQAAAGEAASLFFQATRPELEPAQK